MSRIQTRGEKLGIPGKAITWAGVCRWNNRICIGTEDGFVGFVDHPILTKVVDNPINGIAFNGDTVAVTTTEEIVTIQRNPADDLGFVKPSLVFDGGAHGVVASPAGCFLAPLGKDGVLAFRSLPQGGVQVQIGGSHGGGRYYSKLIQTGQLRDHEPVFACATRSSGLFVFSLESGALAALGAPDPDDSFDVIDVCWLGSPAWPRAAACLTDDRAIVLFKDVLTPEPRQELSLSGLNGRAYEIASLQRHLFVLTEERLYVLQNVAERFFSGDNFDSAVKISGIVIEASDLFVLDENRLALQTGDDVIVYHVADLVSETQQDGIMVDGSRMGTSGEYLLTPRRPRRMTALEPAIVGTAGPFSFSEAVFS